MDQRLKPKPALLRQARAVTSNAVDPVAAARRPRRTFWWVFGGLAGVLVARNHFLFTNRIYEEGDAAANSILVDNAKHLSQLVGNYSRLGFHHPGPAFLYVQAAGEWLFHDALHIVPTPWNGQLLAVLLLNSALVALAVSIVGRWFRTTAAWRGDIALAAVALIFLASWADLVTSTWPPFEYFTPYLLLLAAGTSVAAGGVRDLWALGLACGLLIHGHAEFLFLATAMAAAAVGALVWPHRRELKFFVWVNDGHLLRALAVVVIALVPIVLNTLRHWPGEFGRYLGYGGDRALNEPGPAIWYVMRQWDMSPVLAPAVLVGCLAAMALAAARSQHVYAKRALVFVGLGLGTALFYAMVGVDNLGEPYILFFSRAMPLFALLVSVAVVASYGPGRRTLTALVGLGAVVLSVLSPALLNRQVTVDDVPGAFDRLPRDKPIVLVLATPSSWAEALPLAVEGHRRGLRLCFVDPQVEMMATPAYMCNRGEQSVGLTVIVARRGQEPGGLRPVADLGLSRIWTPATERAGPPAPVYGRRDEAWWRARPGPGSA